MPPHSSGVYPRPVHRAFQVNRRGSAARVRFARSRPFVLRRALSRRGWRGNIRPCCRLAPLAPFDAVPKCWRRPGISPPCTPPCPPGPMRSTSVSTRGSMPAPGREFLEREPRRDHGARPPRRRSRVPRAQHARVRARARPRGGHPAARRGRGHGRDHRSGPGGGAPGRGGVPDAGGAREHADDGLERRGRGLRRRPGGAPGGVAARAVGRRDPAPGRGHRSRARGVHSRRAVRVVERAMPDERGLGGRSANRGSVPNPAACRTTSWSMVRSATSGMSAISSAPRTWPACARWRRSSTSGCTASRSRGGKRGRSTSPRP